MTQLTYAFDLERFTQRLDNLKAELDAKQSLKHILDADLEHNLSASRLMGVLPKESEPVEQDIGVHAVSPETPATMAPLHPHPRPGRKKIHGSATKRQRAAHFCREHGRRSKKNFATH
jgi:hypothetical protein